MKRFMYAAAFGVGFLGFVAAAPILADAPSQVTSVSDAIGSTLTKTAVDLTNDGSLDLSKLLKISDADGDYTITYDDTVSLDPLSQATVSKVGYGHVSEVNIVTTSSGTYSSDALKSPHVLYPGIEVSRETDFPVSLFAFYSLGGKLLSVANNAHSFTYFGKMQGGGMYTTSHGSTCFYTKDYTGCK